MEPLQQIQQAIAAADYDLVASLCEAWLDSAPAEKMACWYLGLARLLQEQEEEAQALWMMAMLDGTPEQVDGWTADLVAVLQTEAERQDSLEQPEIAWALRQYVREVCPTDLSNLLELVRLSANLGRLQPEEWVEWGVIAGLPTWTEPLSGDRALACLKAVVDCLPLAPESLELADALVQKVQDPLLVHHLMLKAVQIAYEFHQPLDAVRYGEFCRRFCPEDLQVLSHLAEFYQNAQQYEAGIETAKQCCILARAIPDQVFAACLLTRAYMRGGSYWNEIFELLPVQESLFEQFSTAISEPCSQNQTLFLSTSTFFLPYVRDTLAANRQIQNQVFQQCQISVRHYAAEAVARYQQGLASRNYSAPKRPLRIGYLSHCFRRHSVGWLARWLIQYHDRDRFQVYGYLWNYLFQINDPLQAWYVEQFDVARKLGRDGLEIAEQIYQDEIDILIDLDSVTADSCTQTLALKPAPVQVTWLGWDASGLPAIDYFIVDPYVLPPDAEAHYHEKLWRLPQTYLAVDGFELGVPTLRREDLDISPDAIIYLSSQSPFKRHPDTVRSQLQIIRQVPNSYFLIKGFKDNTSIQDYFYALAAAEGVARDRLRFLPEVRQEEVHRANLAIADVVLDTYPYNGATTTLETLWMGIPLVTRVGEHFSSRNSYTMLVNAGVEEGIAWSAEEYLQWGIRFGTEADLRQRVYWKLRQSRRSSPLWNARQFTREMERTYEQMWLIQCQQRGGVEGRHNSEHRASQGDRPDQVDTISIAAPAPHNCAPQ